MSEAVAPAPASRRILAGYFTLAGLYTLSAALIWGVNTLFLLDAGLSFFEVFVANAAFSAGMVLFEVPTGVVADTLGRRVSFLLSVSVLAATTLLYVGLAEVGAGVVPFAIVSVGIGLGYTFYSGAMEAWLVDALDATGIPRPARPRVRPRAAGHGRRHDRRHRGRRAPRADRPVTAVPRAHGAPPRSLRRRVRRDARPRLRAAAGDAERVAGRDVAECEGGSRVRLAAAQSPSAHPRVGGADGVLLVGVLRVAAVPARAPRQRCRLDLRPRCRAIALSTIMGNQVVTFASRYCGRRTTLLTRGRFGADGRRRRASGSRARSGPLSLRSSS